MRGCTVYDILSEIMDYGRVSRPRGEEVKELDYFSAIFTNPWSTYPERNYNVDYFKREFQWYLGANPEDQRICKHAKMWRKLVQEDGQIFSNYGYYWFGPQDGFNWVVTNLLRDPDSRQAYIAMNNYHHAFPGNKDFVCTKGIQFRIIDGDLCMHVAMRSSDAIFGMGTDLPCFFYLWKMVASELGLETGHFKFSADSVHIYERHYEMVNRILNKDSMHLPGVDAPELDDVDDLLCHRYQSEFGQWLKQAPL